MRAHLPLGAVPRSRPACVSIAVAAALLACAAPASVAPASVAPASAAPAPAAAAAPRGLQIRLLSGDQRAMYAARAITVRVSSAPPARVRLTTRLRPPT